jgi:molybdopterin-guanine dinucleotide biosynthesis protein A
MMKIPANSAILVGGKSLRLGFDKAFLRLGDEYVSERLVRLMASMFSSVCFIASTKRPLPVKDVKVYYDREPGLGPLGGLLTALLNSEHDYTFIVPCDLPFIQPRLIELLWRQNTDAEIIIPFYNDHMEPLAAFYHKKCIPHIEQALYRSERHMLSFHANLFVQKFALQTFFTKAEIERMLFNINFPEDYKKALEIDKEE